MKLQVFAINYVVINITHSLHCIFQSKCDFYMEFLHQFRSLKMKLSDSVTPETLAVVQRMVDKHVRLYSYLYIS